MYYNHKQFPSKITPLMIKYAAVIVTKKVVILRVYHDVPSSKSSTLSDYFWAGIRQILTKSVNYYLHVPLRIRRFLLFTFKFIKANYSTIFIFVEEHHFCISSITFFALKIHDNVVLGGIL